MNTLVKKSYCLLKNLYANRTCLTRNIKIRLCDTLILSIFNYCDIVYGPCLDAHTSMRIQKVQNSCVRFVFGLQCRDHTTPFIKDIKWLKMLNRRNLHLACFTHKVLVTSCPNYLSSKLLPRTYIHNKNLRYTNQLTTPQHTTALFQRSFSYQAVTTYNSIPEEFKSLSLPSFKSKVKKLYLDKQ